MQVGLASWQGRINSMPGARHASVGLLSLQRNKHVRSGPSSFQYLNFFLAYTIWYYAKPKVCIHDFTFFSMAHIPIATTFVGHSSCSTDSLRVMVRFVLVPLVLDIPTSECRRILFFFQQGGQCTFLTPYDYRCVRYTRTSDLIINQTREHYFHYR